MIVAPTQSNLLAALKSFLVAVLPVNGPDGKPLDIIAAQQNRIPEPRGASFVVMTPTRMERIETNVDSVADANFTGSFAGTTMTISAVDPRFPTRLRDGFGVEPFANQSPNYGVVPLYADDARQLPFTNDQQQVETRWVVDALLQANVVVSVPQQFADTVGLVLEDVDAVFPP